MEKSNLKQTYWSFRWKHLSKKILKRNSACYICAERSKVVDHVVAYKHDVDSLESFFNKQNLLPLCFHCHARVTKKFDRFVREKTSTEDRKKLAEDKLIYIKEMRARYGSKHSIII